MSTSSCPLCGGPAPLAFETFDRNRRLTEDRFRYRRCESCGVVSLENPPGDLGRWYPPDYYGLPDRAELERAAAAESWRVELIGRFAPSGRLVEVGPGAGAFALRARQAGYEVVGIEMDAACCEHLRSVVGARAIQSDAPEEALAEVEDADAIAFWHVLEHLPRPWEFLERAAAKLRPGGVLALAVPNPDSLQFRLMRGRWPHVDAPRHAWLIPSGTLLAKARELGLTCEALTSADPTTLDLNQFGWTHAVAPPGATGIGPALLHRAGGLVTRVVRPFERRGLRGSAYTAVLRRAA